MPEQILTEISGTESNLIYKIDGVDLKEYGIRVSASTGIIDALSIKEPQTKEWFGEHGKVVDLTAPRYNSRIIELDCGIKASSKFDFLTKINTFIKAIQKPELRRLELSISTKPLIYNVYLPDGVAFEKKWSDSTMIGTFKLKFEEPTPVKRLLKFTGTAPSITLTSSNAIDIYWGDGTSTKDVYGTNVTKTKTYASSSTYYILLAGVIEEISNFSTNAEVVWSRY